MSAISTALIANMTALLDHSDPHMPHPGDGLCSTLPILLSSIAADRQSWLDAQEGDLATLHSGSHIICSQVNTRRQPRRFS